MTELSLTHSYAFRWQDARRASARRHTRSFLWPLLVATEVAFLLLLLGAYIFIANDRVRLETTSRSFSLTLVQTEETVSSLSLTLAQVRAPQGLEEAALASGLIAPKELHYLSL